MDSLEIHIKKRRRACFSLPAPHLEALALPCQSERATSKPHAECIYNTIRPTLFEQNACIRIHPKGHLPLL